MARAAGGPVRLALDDGGNNGELEIAFVNGRFVFGVWDEGEFFPQLLHGERREDYEGEDHEEDEEEDWESEDSGYGSMEDEDEEEEEDEEAVEEEEEEEEEDDPLPQRFPPGHPLTLPFGVAPPAPQRSEESAPSTSGLGSSAKRTREEDYGEAAPSTAGLGSSAKRTREEDYRDSAPSTSGLGTFRRYWQRDEDSDSD